VHAPVPLLTIRSCLIQCGIRSWLLRRLAAIIYLMPPGRPLGRLGSILQVVVVSA
jgi:hypothetical protein